MPEPAPAAAFGKMPFGTAPPTLGSAPAAPSPTSPATMAQLAPNPFAVATTAEIVIPEPRKKTPLVIGVIVVLLAAVGAAVVLTQKPPPPAPPPVPTVTVQAPTAEAPPPVHTSEPTPTTPQTGGELPTGPRPASSNGSTDFSQMFAAGAEKAQKGDAPGAAKAFDAEEARTAIAGVLKAVAACKEPGGPTGQTSAAVTFAASGQVTSVTVGSPFAGTSTGTCIITAFKAAKVAPFTGLPGTVSQPVSLQ
jgi:hypothetical protein